MIQPAKIVGRGSLRFTPIEVAVVSLICPCKSRECKYYKGCSVTRTADLVSSWLNQSQYVVVRVLCYGSVTRNII